MAESITEARKRNITTQLEKGYQLLNNQLEHSLINLESTERTSSAIADLYEFYRDEVAMGLTGASQIIRTLWSQHRKDVLLLGGSLAFFFGCVLYIIKERLFW